LSACNTRYRDCVTRSINVGSPLQAAVVRGSQIFRVRNRPFAVQVGLRLLGVADLRIGQLRNDARGCKAASLKKLAGLSDGFGEVVQEEGSLGAINNAMVA
jgi:hypothetical protein